MPAPFCKKWRLHLFFREWRASSLIQNMKPSIFRNRRGHMILQIFANKWCCKIWWSRNLKSLPECRIVIRDIRINLFGLLHLEKAELHFFSQSSRFLLPTLLYLSNDALHYIIQSSKFFTTSTILLVKREGSIFCIKLYIFPLKDIAEYDYRNSTVLCYCLYDRSKSEKWCFIFSISRTAWFPSGWWYFIKKAFVIFFHI